jgi:hypothetical protein
MTGARQKMTTKVIATQNKTFFPGFFTFVFGLGVVNFS